MKKFLVVFLFLRCSLNISLAEEESSFFEYTKDDEILLELDDKTSSNERTYSLKAEFNDELKPKYAIQEAIFFETKNMQAKISSSKFINATTFETKIMNNDNFLNINDKQKFLLGYGFKAKEYIPLSDNTNYSLLSSSLYAGYKLGKINFESELSGSKNLKNENNFFKISFGPKWRVTDDLSVKGSIARQISADDYYGEFSLIYEPKKRNFYFEFDASSRNDEYAVLQKRLEFFTKFKI